MSWTDPTNHGAWGPRPIIYEPGQGPPWWKLAILFIILAWLGLPLWAFLLAVALLFHA